MEKIDVERYRPYICKLWRKWRDSIEFSDFFQEASIIIIESTRNYEKKHKTSLASWVMSNLYYKTAENLRKTKIKQERGGFNGFVPYESKKHSISHNENNVDLCYINKIPYKKLKIIDRDKSIFLDYYVSEFTLDELGKKHNVSFERIRQIKDEVLLKIQKNYK